MKVIQNNLAGARFAYPFAMTCVYCKSMLEVEDGDVHTHTGQSDRGPFDYYSVTCGVCSRQNSVEPSREVAKITELAMKTGKSITQLGVALLDARKGEFERLKEFGIAMPLTPALVEAMLLELYEGKHVKQCE